MEMFDSPEPGSPLSMHALKSLQRMALMSKNYGSHKNLLQASTTRRRTDRKGDGGDDVEALWGPRKTGDATKRGGLPEITSPTRSSTDLHALASPINLGSSSRLPTISRSPELALLQPARADVSGSVPASTLIVDLLKAESRPRATEEEVLARLSLGVKATLEGKRALRGPASSPTASSAPRTPRYGSCCA